LVAGGEWLFKGVRLTIEALFEKPKTACAWTMRFREARGIAVWETLSHDRPV
jgi:hypothetical protein